MKNLARTHFIHLLLLLLPMLCANSHVCAQGYDNIVAVG
jgi:hypothetical protein